MFTGTNMVQWYLKGLELNFENDRMLQGGLGVNSAIAVIILFYCADKIV